MIGFDILYGFCLLGAVIGVLFHFVDLMLFCFLIAIFMKIEQIRLEHKS